MNVTFSVKITNTSLYMCTHVAMFYDVKHVEQDVE